MKKKDRLPAQAPARAQKCLAYRYLGKNDPGYAEKQPHVKAGEKERRGRGNSGEYICDLFVCAMDAPSPAKGSAGESDYNTADAYRFVLLNKIAGGLSIFKQSFASTKGPYSACSRA